MTSPYLALCSASWTPTKSLILLLHLLRVFLFSTFPSCLPGLCLPALWLFGDAHFTSWVDNGRRSWFCFGVLPVPFSLQFEHRLPSHHSEETMLILQFYFLSCAYILLSFSFICCESITPPEVNSSTCWFRTLLLLLLFGKFVAGFPEYLSILVVFLAAQVTRTQVWVTGALESAVQMEKRVWDPTGQKCPAHMAAVGCLWHCSASPDSAVLECSLSQLPLQRAVLTAWIWRPTCSLTPSSIYLLPDIRLWVDSDVNIWIPSSWLHQPLSSPSSFP